MSVPAPSDDVYVDAGSVSTSIARPAGGNFENLAVNGAPATTTSPTRVDTTTVTLTASASVAEGGSIVYTGVADQCGAGAGDRDVEQRRDHRHRHRRQQRAA